MIHDIFMPALSSTMTEGKIVSWAKSPGDKVAKGETVLVVESDKADMDVESFYDGYLAVVMVPAGSSAPVGDAIALIAETEDEIAAAQAQAKSSSTSAPTPTPTPVATPAPTETAPATVAAPVAIAAPPANTGGSNSNAASNGSSNGRLIVSPRAKKLAKELSVDLQSLQGKGTGPYGRIVAADIEQAAGKPVTTTATVAPVSNGALSKVAVVPPSAPVATPPVAGETVAMTTLQNAVVNNMMVSLQVPTYRVGYTITTDALDQLYKQIKSKGVTMTALLAKAVAVTLKKHPVINASYGDKAIVYHGAINIAVAVAMPDGGLITPVLRNADQLDIYSLSRMWKDLVDRARAKQLQPEEYNSGTFTISNLGMFGVDRFDAILPPGLGGILAVGASRPQVVANDAGLIGVERQMQVNLTADHRIIYGADAANFLKDLASLIENEAQSLTTL